MNNVKKKLKTKSDKDDQNEWHYFEFYHDDMGLPGIAIITTRGSIDFLNCEQWSKRDDADEIVNCYDEHRLIWALPRNPKPYLDEYNRLIEGLRDSGNYPEDHGLAEEFTSRVLQDLEHKMSILDPLFLKMDSSNLYSLIHSVVVQSYFVDDFSVSPLLMIDAEHGSGKSAVLDYFEALCYHAEKTSNYSAASMVLLAHKYRSTLLLDEGTKNLRNRDRGYSISDILTEGFSKREATYIRAKGENYESLKIQRHYTTVVSSLLEDCPQDLKDRSIIIRMLKDLNGFKPLKVFEYDVQEAAERLDAPACMLPSFDEIRTRLYALFLLVKLMKIKNEPPVFSFKPFEVEAKRLLRHNEEINGTKRFLYGEIYGYEKTPEFLGRAEDICLVHLPIGLAMGVEKDILDIMLDRISEDPTLEVSTESTILRALMDEIKERVSQETLEWDKTPPTWEYLTKIICTICTRDVRIRYNTIREERDDWGPYDMESPKTITALMNRMGLKYDTGTSNKSYFTPNELFRKALRSAVMNYGGSEVKRYFANV